MRPQLLFIFNTLILSTFTYLCFDSYKVQHPINYQNNAISINNADSIILIKLYEATNGDNWDNSWNTILPMNTWEGVTLDKNNCVTHLILNDNGLVDTIPPSIGDLEELITLNLSENDLSGLIPSEIKNLTNLIQLDLSFNNFSGCIPDEIEKLGKLEYLNLANNNIEENIPSEIKSLTNLIQLDLSFNNFSGRIPDEIEKLGKLEYLNLANNNIGGNIPDEIDSLINLRTLILSNNNIDESIPDEIGDLTNLHTLILDNNNLTGEIPDDLCKLSNLKVLSLSNNNLVGTIPEELGDLTNLSSIFLSSNCLTGQLPFQFSDSLEIHENKFTFEHILPVIENGNADLFVYAPQDSIFQDTTITVAEGGELIIKLGIDENITTSTYKWIKGTDTFTTTRDSLNIPAIQASHAGTYYVEVTNPNAPDLTLYSFPITVVVTGSSCGVLDLLELEKFYDAMQDNGAWTEEWDFNNPIDSFFGVTLNSDGCVQRIVLPNNGLSGQLPTDLNLPHLEILDLNNNNISDTIPNFSFLPALSSLILSHNNLTGSIPDEIGSLSKLEYLNLANNNIDESIPDEIGDLTNLIQLDLSFNNLSESIPDEIEKLGKLEYLSLANNNIDGSIPDEIDSLINLRTLILSNNNIDESIPDEIGDLTNLRTLILDNNNLIEEIPDDLYKLSNLEVLSLSNNNLVGTIPEELSNLTNLSSIFLSSNCLTSPLPFQFSDSVEIHENKFTFEHILPVIENGNADLFVYAPQDSIFQDTTITVAEGGELIIKLGIDENITTSTYKWIKETDTWTTTSDSLNIPAIQASHAGTYYVEVTNPNAPDLTLYSFPITVIVAGSSCHTLDSMELKRFYDAMQDNGAWTEEWDFNNPIDSFFGVTLNSDGCVQRIVLPNNGLSGQLPTDLNLPHLEILDLNTNNISGTIPNFPFFPELCSLILSHNNLTGSIPNFSSLSKLKVLHAHNNMLQGAVPNFNLPALEVLFLGENPNINDVIPSFESLINLKNIRIKNADLSGELPSFTFNTELQTIDFSGNELTGNIPAWSNLLNLKSISLHFNSLEGQVPDNFPINLTKLLIHSNNLDSLPNLDTLTFDTTLTSGLRIQDNNFTFDDIILNLSDLDTSFRYAPQKMIYVDTIIAVPKCSDYTIDLGIDAGIADNEYHWFRNGTPIDTTNVNQYTITDITFAAVYNCKVINPNVPDLTLMSHPISIILSSNEDCDCPNTSLSVIAAESLICAGDSTEIIIEDSEIGFNYTLNIDQTNIGESIVGNGVEITFPTGALTENTPFSITLTEIDNADCSFELLDRPLVEISELDVDMQKMASGNDTIVDICINAGIPPFIITIDPQAGDTLSYDGDCVYNIRLSNLPPEAYNITVTDDLGCMYEEEITLFSTFNNNDEFKYNPLLTPDNNGDNDELNFNVVIEDESSLGITIFNRYGDKVYENEDYQNDWEGTYEGTTLPDGTYYYYLIINGDTSALKSGYITLLTN